jgi:ketose-bisphosphate aldolase
VPIVRMREILDRARTGGYAVGYFEAWDQHSLEAIANAAEEMHSPTILGFGGAVVSQPWFDAGGLEELAACARCLAERLSVPAAVLLNEAQTYGQVLRGLRAGCNAVMLTSSQLPYEENVAWTQRVMIAAHALDAWVEGELGELADASGRDPSHACATDPLEAAHFVQATGVDGLAVSIGNVHMLTLGQASVDLDLLQRIHTATPVPLVIHGGSGFPAQAVQAAIGSGVCKFNVGTRLKGAFLTGIQEALGTLATPIDVQLAIGSRKPGDILVRGQGRLKEKVIEYMQLYGCVGQAVSR